MRCEEVFDETIGHEQEIPQSVEDILRFIKPPPVVVVDRNQDADRVVRRVRHEAAAGKQCLEAMVELIMVRNGMNTGCQRTTYASPLPDYILQTELPRG